jgi:plasmid stabilization system protein ParE
MVNKYSVYWTTEAKSDLKSIFEYISSVESRKRALYVVTDIRKKAKETAGFPTKHAKEPYINKDNVRYALKWSYKIVFEIKENTVRILKIFHTAQNPEKNLPEIDLR